MKRYGNLFSQIIKFDNLLKAAKTAEKGKRYRDNVLDFNYLLLLFADMDCQLVI